MDFPVFRKYTDNKSYFKVSSDLDFEELKVMGRYYSLIRIHVNTLPERNFLNDMLRDYKTYWIVITEKEYEEQKTYCLQQLHKIEL